MKWNVCVTFDASAVVEVEAETEAEAKEKALCEASASLCHQCAREINLGDPLEAVEAWQE